MKLKATEAFREMLLNASLPDDVFVTDEFGARRTRFDSVTFHLDKRNPRMVLSWQGTDLWSMELPKVDLKRGETITIVCPQMRGSTSFTLT